MGKGKDSQNNHKTKTHTHKKTTTKNTHNKRKNKKILRRKRRKKRQTHFNMLVELLAVKIGRYFTQIMIHLQGYENREKESPASSLPN